eukprot:TRINITY_DN2669_c0_g1_i1.p1 TRINITY_DN2669_c0_g1~~TRINITY_DN2669_c0_g1_i1.p1  ORF type:complete len:533 (+),score=57.08 TRINITY_DN2669_c0_g1_i1:113-1600(+)
MSVASSSSGFAKDCLDFINYAWTPYHAVEQASKLLTQAGFTQVLEREPWKIQPGGKYYFTRHYSTLVAFVVGGDYKVGDGFQIIGAHTDSPCLKLKTASKLEKSGFEMLNVETYGGGLWHTWFDRDLGVAGRLLIRNRQREIRHRLVKIDRPIARIPMLAIHLNRDIGTQGLKPNTQNHLAAMLSPQLDKEKFKSEESTNGKTNAENDNNSKEKHVFHSKTLMKLLEEVVGGLKEGEEIIDSELQLCDVQPGSFWGPENEFVAVGRLDNLAMSYAALRSLIDGFSDEGAVKGRSGVAGVALFDHEEVGSSSMQGAGGPVMRDAMTRITKSLSGTVSQEELKTDLMELMLNRSFVVSADMAHALHPNYPEKHDEKIFQPRFGKGVTIKTNQNQRYATNAVSATIFREVARMNEISMQEFEVRNDMPCGSTIGPIISTNLGCRTVDVGAPQIAMHSIREMCAAKDLDLTYQHFMAFYQNFYEVEKKLNVDDPNLQYQ